MTTGIFVPKPVFGPNGEKWAGRGRKPAWLKALEAAKQSADVNATTPVQPNVPAGQTTESN